MAHQLHRTGRTARLATLSLGMALAASPALAHHPLGGELPSTFAHGLLSGIGHPIIGLDHLAFVIAVGLAARLAGRPLLLPLAFVLATMGGTLLHLSAIGLPLVEVAIAASVAVLGAMLLAARSFGAPIYVAVFAVAGLFHGHAYGEAVFGAEATPVLAYLLGFGAAQYAVATLAGLVLAGAGIGSEKPMRTRLSGAMIAGAGVLLVSDHVLAAIGLA